MDFPPATHPENESQSGRRFRVAVSVCGIIRKLRPSLSRYSGTGFPTRSLLGKRVPPCAAATFSLRPRPAQSSILRGSGLPLTGWDREQTPDRHRICFGLRLCAENPRVRFANPHRLRPPAGVLARSLQTLAPCTEFDSPRYGGSVDGLGPGQDARSASHPYLVESLRGESAYLLRKSAPASAACRRPRPLATNASRLLNARALHRVRFSAVSDK